MEKKGSRDTNDRSFTASSNNIPDHHSKQYHSMLAKQYRKCRYLSMCRIWQRLAYCNHITLGLGNWWLVLNDSSCYIGSIHIYQIPQGNLSYHNRFNVSTNILFLISFAISHIRFHLRRNRSRNIDLVCPNITIKRGLMEP